MKLIHLITGLEIGGANMMLYKLLKGAQNPELEYSVIVLMDKGMLGEPIERLGVPVYEIGMSRSRLSPSVFMELHKMLTNIGPDLIQAWTYHSNIAASILGLFSPKTPILWNIRHTPYDLASYKRLTYLLIRYGKWLSWQPKQIIYNSQVSARRHQELGYPAGKTKVIPNGFDTEQYRPSESAYLALRKELNLPHEATIIGMVARYHPMKDHANFLSAAGKLHGTHPDVHFILIGRGVDQQNHELMTQISRLKLNGNVHLLGERSNIAVLTAGLDIACLTSAWGDAFPNVIGEAMACGVPCVATDIGDSSLIIRDTGIIVQPQNAEALAQGWKKILDLEKSKHAQLGKLARRRVEENFSLDKVVEAYENLYLEILS